MTRLNTPSLKKSVMAVSFNCFYTADKVELKILIYHLVRGCGCCCVGVLWPFDTFKGISGAAS